MAGFDPMSFFNLATSQSSNYWLALGINTILSTIVGGIVLIVLAEVFSHKFGESIKPQNAFLIVLLANVATNFGVIGLLGGFLSGIPFILMVLPVVVWFGLIKAFFHEMNILHAFLVAVIFYMLTLLVIPYITSIISGFIPLGI